MTDGYNMKIPQDLADFIQKYISEHPELGMRFVSQYVVQILREDIRQIMNNYPKKKKEEKRITLSSGNYTKEDIEKLFKDS